MHFEQKSLIYLRKNVLKINRKNKNLYHNH